MYTNGLANRPAWTPAPFRFPPQDAKKSLGQGGGFLDSPVLAVTLDGWTTLTAAYLGWGFGQRHNNWSTFWYVVAAVSGFKFLHDLGRIKK
jgi:hypothetical protein